MEQTELRQWENRCIQDEPAPCVAACPLHVDARALAGHMAAGGWVKALAVLNKTMPLPGILGRICDAPCQAVCNRAKVGGGIRIAELERACVSRSDKPKRVLPLPKKPIRVAVIGSGLSSLTAAWDLARKGYDLTLFEPGNRMGGGLIDRYAGRLSEDAVGAEVKRIGHLGVQFETGVALDADIIRQSFAAVYVGLDGILTEIWGLKPEASLPAGRFPGDTGTDGVFAGGGHPSPVWQAATGRWCATSMDRWLQKVSMDAGRENEGPVKTRLITNLEGIASLPAVAMADSKNGYAEDEAQAEASRCLQCQCLECVKVCEYLDAFKGYPKTYAREIYNNLSIVMGERKSNRLINSCSLCGLCEAVCPNDFAMQDLCLAARQDMVRRDKMPPSAHDFALQDMAFSQSDAFFMARHAPGQSQSQYLFFPGCQLAASMPGQVTRVYDYLREKLVGGVAMMLGCCGAPAHWSGRQAQFLTELSRWETTWKELGCPQPVMACATCLKVFKDHLPSVEPVSLWEVVDKIGIPQAGVFRPDGPLAIHDPCTSRDAPGVQEAVRRLVDRLNVSAEELDLGRERTECCGFGGLMENANPDLAKKVTETRSRRSNSDYLAYCAMCRDVLAGVGKRTVHLLDLMFPDQDVADPAARPRTGWSRRRENRQQLKSDLLRELWNETVDDSGEPDPAIRLVIAPEVAEILQSRRILEENLRRVIHHAETGGIRFCNGETGQFLGMQRLGHATFWVVYTPAVDGYVVHNAYSHRMEVVGP
ncbi:4Fe-4S ferredoxin iron-sulfur binding domain protein [Desulfosarcina variabilis str. Montpellier]|uniref:pyridine nucleotide-disulfide oxidoreductase/dicluster-binding protein n=1 Tax=Desulfosarcina variabilis TaxID=2300 RepID=UPI003AFA5D44